MSSATLGASSIPVGTTFLGVPGWVAEICNALIQFFGKGPQWPLIALGP